MSTSKALLKTVGVPPHRLRRRSAYTLLELVLALSLATIVLGLVSMAIHVQLRVVDKSRGQVEEAQLMRAILQRMAEDIRNAVPFGASAPSTAGTSAAPPANGAADPTAAATASSSTTPFSGGIVGSAQEIQVETNRQPRPNLSTPVEDSSQPARLSNIRTVTYSLGDPGNADATLLTQATSGLDSNMGLYRREVDRAEFTWATKQGDTDSMGQSTQLLAPEVIDLEITYYDGSTPSDTWDSTQQSKLPSAVKVAVAIRRSSDKSSAATSATIANNDGSLIVYDMLIDLPNSLVSSGTSSPASTSSSPPSP